VKYTTLLCALTATATIALLGCTGDGIRVSNDSDADGFVDKTVNTAFAKWDADALCSSVSTPNRANCLKRLPSWFRRDRVTFGEFVRAGDTRSKTYWAFMRNIKDAYYDVDLTYAKGTTHLEVYVMNLDKQWGVSGENAGWRVVWYRLFPEASR
jgi:hypothetical protein